MGIRFRKTIRLPFGINLNIGKKGLGYSWGFKGFRIGKGSNGNVRKTFTLPGTGLSYVDEGKGLFGSKRAKNKEVIEEKEEVTTSPKNADELIKNNRKQNEDDGLDKILKLKKLLDEGAITEEEYNREKDEILNK